MLSKDVLTVIAERISVMRNNENGEDLKTSPSRDDEKLSLKDGLSINEGKFSVLVLAFLLTLFYSFFLAWDKGDIPENLTTLLMTLAALIAGYNAMEFLKRKL